MHANSPSALFLSLTGRLRSAVAITVAACGLLTLSASAADLDLCVMTYNVRVPVDKTPYTWAERREPVAACIRSFNPDLIGTQEGVGDQLKDLNELLPEYVRLGQAREGGEKGEFSALMYRKDRFTVIESGDFWLSDTPDAAGSKTWGNNLPRMVSWARLKDIPSGREFQWFNTHFDHQSQPSRERSAELLLSRAKAVDSALPLIITGDFNATAGENAAYTILTGDGAFVDTWGAAKEREGEGINSFNGFANDAIPGGRRIDWVLVRGKAEVSKAVVSPFKVNGRFPSDHFPVISWLRLLL